MPGAAFAVHQLRYWLAFGNSAGLELQRQGHAYLNSLVPWVVMLLAVAMGIFLRALGRAFDGHCSLRRVTVSFAGLWFACSACLVAIYVCQESLEGMLVAGHPAGLAGILGHGGWWSVPAAVCIGLVLAAVFHGARWMLREVAGRHARAVWHATKPYARARLPRAIVLPRLAPIANGWSDRGPPG